MAQALGHPALTSETHKQFLAVASIWGANQQMNNNLYPLPLPPPCTIVTLSFKYIKKKSLSIQQLSVIWHARNKQISLLLKITENILKIYLSHTNCSKNTIVKLRIKKCPLHGSDSLPTNPEPKHTSIKEQSLAGTGLPSSPSSFHTSG